MLTISTGYDPGYLTRAVATGRENYYLSAVAQHSEPPGIWTGAGCPELSLAVGSQVDPAVMERLYGGFVDPRDPGGLARLGRAPSRFAGLDEKIAGRIEALLAAEPDATPERRGELIMRALGERRAPVFFFDVTFSVPKSVSLLHASLQLQAEQARDHGQNAEATVWERRAQAVWDAIMAANQAMLGYLQREAGYSRAGYHGQGSGRFADAHDWVVASFPQHTSRDGDPQLHVHNAVLNRVLRDDPLAAEGQRIAWRTVDGAGLYAARPAAGAIAERTLAGRLTERLGVEVLARPDGNGWEMAGIGEELRGLFSSWRRAITPRVAHLVEEYTQKHGRKPSARAVIAPLLAKAGASAGVGIGGEDSGDWVRISCTGNKGRKDNPAYVGALLRHGARVDQRYNGATPLHYVVRAGFVETIQILLEHGADPDALDDSGRTPLDWLGQAGKAVDRDTVRDMLTRASRLR